LVLGAGGPVGHAYHAGALKALEEGLGWDARDADLIVGTSAGAQVGALLRAGLSGSDLAARAAGEELHDEAGAIAKHFVRPCHKTPDPDLPRRLVPASPGMLLASLRRPGLLRPGRLLSALLPEGRVRLDAQSAGLRRVFGDVWPERDLWIPSVHLDSGDRVVFGSPGAPAIDVGTAVTCSGAVPGVHAAVRWDGKRYVDGGVASATHLDLLPAKKFDLVIVSSPLSMFSIMQWALWRDIGELSPGTKVVALEPSEDALRVMGRNPMAVEKAPGVVSAAYQSTLGWLEREGRDRFVGLF
jgi:NTE family protein